MRGEGKTTIEVSLETRELLRRVSQRVGMTYDEVLKMLLESFENLLNCRVRVDEVVGDVILVCDVGEEEPEEISIDRREYRRLRKVLKFLLKPKESLHPTY
ncbi:MAG: hypothetical protein B7O98_07020 [Zestosphaera tikiterensis]|uniref:Uncharacterized protein n=1 Tax=Zestosphaera tikiterensis TaxID=1973259 RepID=A0A2R7Y4U4_9CREN|nr:MAG: hypothetical protein B7O98_07020 [Zestosphaera tikiterensis]